MEKLTKEEFFDVHARMGLALTYDDVRIETRSGQNARLGEIDISSKFSENIGVKTPIVSAGMDTVTESDTAIEMGKNGSFGVMHPAMSIERQYEEVRRVKKASHNLIDTPISVSAKDTLEDVLKMCDRRRFDFRSFPVEDADKKMIGLLTSDDFDFPEDLSTPVEEAMTPIEDIVTAATGTSLSDAYELMKSTRITTLPLRGDNGEVGGLYLWSDVKRNIREADLYNVDENGQLITAVAITTGQDTLERISHLEKYVDVWVLDSADGDSYYMFETLKAIKKNFPNVEVVAGNVSDGASALELAQAGANGVKVGQGPGSICSTRIETGIGMPQVTAIYNCVMALKASGFSHIPLSADGGLRNHGDFPVAIAAGAHTTMVGKMLAGTKEAPTPIIVRKDGSRVKLYRGMGSISALNDNESSRERYAANKGSQILAEGVESYVPYSGDLKDVLGLCILGLKKGMRYAKNQTIEEHREKATFIRITGSGLRESHPHDVELI